MLVPELQGEGLGGEILILEPDDQMPVLGPHLDVVGQVCPVLVFSCSLDGPLVEERCCISATIAASGCASWT